MSKINRIKSIFLDSSSNINKAMKHMQNIVGAAVIIILFFITILLHFASSSKPNYRSDKQAHTKVDSVISTDFTGKNEVSALSAQQLEMDKLTKQLAAMKKINNSKGHDQPKDKVVLVDEINSILAKRTTKANAISAGKMTAQPYSNQSSNYSSALPQHHMQTISFQYATPSEHLHRYTNRGYVSNKKTPVNYVPAGTFAKGVLLEGADANASVNAQSDTTPILVRVLSSGTLPNGHHSHLRGCFVLASMYGDISSERGEARLTTISCTKKDGSILEKKVHGYLSFAGKEGIKGEPVMRNGKILAMAGVSGMLSGFGSALQQTTQTQSTSPLGSTTTVNPANVMQNGLYGGASTAMNQLAGYYIKRADQYHPIIEIGSGTVATIIFQNGFSLVEDDGQDSSSSVAAAPKTDNSASIKSLLQQAQHLSQNKTSAPFSMVN
jgi:conjugal transfer pilus assembly protein TraB